MINSKASIYLYFVLFVSKSQHTSVGLSKYLIPRQNNNDMIMLTVSDVISLTIYFLVSTLSVCTCFPFPAVPPVNNHLIIKA